MVSYTTYLPSKFTLLGTKKPITLSASQLENAKNHPLFIPWIPINRIPEVEKVLRQLGFKDSIPAEPQGEKIGLSKSLTPNNPEWELHIRIFENGDIKPHIEVNREYLEHLTHPRIYVIYEAYEYYRTACPEFYLKYQDQWVSKIYENYSITLPSPSSLTPWKPIVEGAAFAAIIGVAIWALSRPPKGE